MKFFCKAIIGRDAYLVFDIFGLVLASERDEMSLKERLELVRERRELRVVGVLDVSRAHDSLEELPLQDDFHLVVHVVWLDAELLMQLYRVLFLFLFTR